MPIFLPACINLYHVLLADGCQIANSFDSSYFLKWAWNVIIIAHCIPLVIVTGRCCALWSLFVPCNPEVLENSKLRFTNFTLTLKWKTLLTFMHSCFYLVFAWVFLIFLPAHEVISVDTFEHFLLFSVVGLVFYINPLLEMQVVLDLLT